MLYRYHNIIIDVQSISTSNIKAMQYDNLTNVVNLYLKNYEIRDEDIYIALRRPDDKVIKLSVSKLDGYLRFTLTEFCLSVAGTAVAEVKIKKNKEVLTIAIILIHIQKSVLNRKIDDIEEHPVDSELNPTQSNLIAGEGISIEDNVISVSYELATHEQDGLMPKEDKIKLDQVAEMHEILNLL